MISLMKSLQMLIGDECFAKSRRRQSAPGLDRIAFDRVTGGVIDLHLAVAGVIATATLRPILSSAVAVPTSATNANTTASELQILRMVVILCLAGKPRCVIREHGPAATGRLGSEILSIMFRLPDTHKTRP
jgi:hypothetical protein